MARLHPRYRNAGKSRQLIGYYAEFYDADRRPKQKRISLGTKDKVSARQRLSELEREYAMGLYDPWRDGVRKDGVPVAEAVKAFLKSREGRSKKTIRNYADILRIFEESLPAGCLIRHVEERHLKAFLSRKSINATSRKTYLRHLGVFFTWAVKEKLIEVNPADVLKARQKGARKSRQQPEFLTEGQVEKLVRCIEADHAARAYQGAGVDGRWLVDIVRFAVNTGLRRGEICSLQWGAVKLAERLLKVRNTEAFQTKSGAERSIFLAGTSWDVIGRLAQERTSESDGEYVFKSPIGGQVREDYLSKRFRYYRRAAGLPEDINFHSLRHTFASWAVMRGMDLYRLKEILGHSDIQVTMRYAHLRPDATRQDMERFFGEGKSAATLQEKNEKLQAENERLQAENEELRRELARLQATGA